MKLINENIDWFSLICGFASIIGLGITCFTLIKVWNTKKVLNNLKKNALFNARCPELIDELKEHNSALIRIIPENNKSVIKSHLNDLRTSLKSLQSINQTKEINILIKTIDKQFKGKYVEKK